MEKDRIFTLQKINRNFVFLSSCFLFTFLLVSSFQANYYSLWKIIPNFICHSENPFSPILPSFAQNRSFPHDIDWSRDMIGFLINARGDDEIFLETILSFRYKQSCPPLFHPLHLPHRMSPITVNAKGKWKKGKKRTINYFISKC